VEEEQEALICFREEQGRSLCGEISAPLLLVLAHAPVRTWGITLCDMDVLENWRQMPLGVCNRMVLAGEEIGGWLCAYLPVIAVLSAINEAQSSGGLPRSSIALNTA
jgi:hypothetical protein